MTSRAASDSSMSKTDQLAFSNSGMSRVGGSLFSNVKGAVPSGPGGGGGAGSSALALPAVGSVLILLVAGVRGVVLCNSSSHRI